MNRPRVLRRLRIGVSVACLAFGLFMALLWARNLRRADVAWAPLGAHGTLVLASSNGQLELALYLPSGPNPRSSWQNAANWGWESYNAPNRLVDILFPRIKTFRFRRLPRERIFNIIAPYWFVVLTPTLCAAAPWIRWSRQFSLRAMLFVMALVSAILGIYVTSDW